jgi:hypothetical protein
MIYNHLFEDGTPMAAPEDEQANYFSDDEAEWDEYLQLQNEKAKTDDARCP